MAKKQVKKEEIKKDEFLEKTDDNEQLLISSADFWEFETEPIFKGRPLGTKVFDPNDNRLMGYHFVDENGEQFIIGAAHAITKALEMKIKINGVEQEVLGSQALLKIVHKGKKLLKSSGHSFNQFQVSLIKE